MTYHKASDKLHCHYCGSKSAPMHYCAQCGSNKISTRNYGTEKVEEDLQRIFPQRRIERMDWDSMKGKDKQAKLLEDFDKGRIDILVGTQMVVKGLDFANVGLVGILSADSLMSYPDFRTNERAFQLMVQVSGRAGRVDGKGEVIIQTYDTQHPLLRWVKNNDFKTYYTNENTVRNQFGYPPYSRMVKIVCKHKDENKVKNAALDLAHKLRQVPDIFIQGPSPAVIPRIQNSYIEEIWIKIPKQIQSLQQTKHNIAFCCNEVQRQKGNSSVQLQINVDPV